MTKTQKALARAKNAQSALRSYKAGATVRAGMNASFVAAGAAGSGALRGIAGDDFMGVPTDAASALILATAGAALDMPGLIYAAAGCAAPYIQDWAAGLVSSTIGA